MIPGENFTNRIRLLTGAQVANFAKDTSVKKIIRSSAEPNIDLMTDENIIRVGFLQGFAHEQKDRRTARKSTPYPCP